MPTSPKQRSEAVTEARRLIQDHGLSANKAAQQVADNLGVTSRSIQTWAQKDGNPLGDTAHEGAQNARTIADAEYQARRAQVRVKMLDTIDYLIDRIHEPHYDYRGKDADKVHFEVAPDGAVKNYVLSAAILLDKIRLEEGKDTSRTTHVVTDDTDQELRNLLAAADASARDRTVEITTDR